MSDGRAGRHSRPKLVARTRKRFNRAGLGGHFTGEGRPKVSHLSIEAAEERAAKLTEATGEPTIAYRCTRCGLWHCGRRSERD